MFWNNELPLNKTIEIPVMIVVVGAIFYENKQILSSSFLDECLYEI